MESFRFAAIEEAEYEERQEKEYREYLIRKDKLRIDHMIDRLSPFLNGLLSLYERYVKAQEKIADNMNQDS